MEKKTIDNINCNQDFEPSRMSTPTQTCSHWKPLVTPPGLGQCNLAFSRWIAPLVRGSAFWVFPWNLYRGRTYLNKILANMKKMSTVRHLLGVFRMRKIEEITTSVELYLEWLSSIPNSSSCSCRPRNFYRLLRQILVIKQIFHTNTLTKSIFWTNSRKLMEQHFKTSSNSTN